MTASSTNPIAQLRQAETQLVRQITRTADMIDQIGTGSLDQAIERLEASVRAAQQRLAAARAAVQALAGELLVDLRADSTALETAVAANGHHELAALPEPAPQPESLEQAQSPESGLPGAADDSTGQPARVDHAETDGMPGDPPETLSGERSQPEVANGTTPRRIAPPGRNGTRRKR